MNPSNKTIIITGASSGIGSAVAREFHEKGWNILANGRDLSRLKSLEDELGDDRVEILQADIGHKENVDSALSLALKKWGSIHAVFIGAGFGIGGNIGEKPMEHAGDMVQINLLGPFYLLEALTPIFRKQGFGHVIGVGSVAGISQLQDLPCTVPPNLL